MGKYVFRMAFPNDAVKAMLQRKGHKVYTGVDDERDVDIYVFSGGPDVTPIYYGERTMPGTFSDLRRDLIDARAYRLAINKPKVGICRGAQFLHVMNGGSLWQDVNNHGVSAGHLVKDLRSGKVVRVTSTHHQMMRGDVGEVIAAAKLATRKQCEQMSVTYSLNDKDRDWDDPEVVFHENTMSLCFQGHPEYHIKECQEYFFSLLDKYIFPHVVREVHCG